MLDDFRSCLLLLLFFCLASLPFDFLAPLYSGFVYPPLQVLEFLHLVVAELVYLDVLGHGGPGLFSAMLLVDLAGDVEVDLSPVAIYWLCQ